MPESWSGLNTAVIILSGVITVVAVYLRMFIRGEVTSMKEAIMTTIKSEFPQKDLVEFRITEHDRRLLRLEMKGGIIGDEPTK